MEARIEIVRYRGPQVAEARVAVPGEEVQGFGIRAALVPQRDGFLLRAVADADVAEFGLDLVLSFSEWRGGYVLVPGAVYDGNRFRVMTQAYPPMFPAEDPDPSPVITDVPRLPAFGLLAGDASTPALGLWSPETGDAEAILFPATIDLGGGEFAYTGLRVEEGEGLTVRVQLPGVRPERYTMVDPRSPSGDRGASVAAGWTLEARIVVAGAETDEVDGLFGFLDECRNDVVAAGERAPLRPFSSVADLIERGNMARRWTEDPGFFQTSDTDHGTPFQVGWVGGGITAFAMLFSDDPLARSRARRNVDFVCRSLQGESGFYLGGYRETSLGRIENDGFGQPHAADWVMVRKSGDMLLFLMRGLLALAVAGEPIPRLWEESARRCAEAFARNAPAFGQFVDARDGRVVVAGSACGGTAIAGLALAGLALENEAYLRAAIAAGEHYATECLLPGHLVGGPGEILKAPDSESAFGLVEGYVALWEATGEARWLDLAERAARQAASWVVPYDFPFPPDSTFARMGMRTGGTVIANVQNKHSAPGICTGSALPLLKLFRATGERRWLDLAVAISHTLPQYVSSDERPILAHEDGRAMPSGWVNERVNMSDWESPARGPGELYDGPCWAMASVLLTALEMPGVYVDPAAGIVACADHMTATIAGDALRIENPTAFDARVRVLVDRDPARPLGESWWHAAPLVAILAGGVATLDLRELAIA